MKTQLITFLFCFTSINAFQCPNGWDQPAGENVCMFPITQPQYYSDVVHQCDLLTATPVKIRNIYENAYVMQFAQANVIYPYIGVERKSDSTWAYADGSPLTYPNWDKGEPSSNLSTHCAILRPDTGKWLADDCSHTRPSICSFDGGNATSPPTTPYLTSPSPSQSGWIEDEAIYWQMINDASCQSHGWGTDYSYDYTGRYVCKTPVKKN
ncbi:unnamed protein product, partial [Mesorhabditis belari]|uniref:C-type lectin domain-containing protein n=1 Tax=Mesorhabditis belari TaxID=2138241 RepID=A0AAF3J3D7_9BILA